VRARGYRGWAVVRLRLVGVDPESKTGTCPTVWVDEDTGELVLQGWDADAPTVQACREVGPVPDTESVVRLPPRMVAAIRKACDVAERSLLR
jgi:hypothetical protein